MFSSRGLPARPTAYLLSAIVLCAIPSAAIATQGESDVTVNVTAAPQAERIGLANDPSSRGGVTSDEQTFVEGGQLFTWRNQRQVVLNSNGSMTRAWRNDDGSGHGGDTLSRQDQDKRFVGDPVAFTWQGVEQQFFSRTQNGDIDHFWWRPGMNDLARDVWVSKDAAGDPAAAAMNGEQHLFYVDTRGALKHKFWGPKNKGGSVLGDTWFEPSSDAEKLVGRPSIFEWRGQQHVAVRNAGGTIMHFWWDPGTGRIYSNAWGKLRALSDPATLVRDNEQSVFYVDERGHVMRNTWSADTQDHHETNWTDRTGENAPNAVARPQVFGTPGQQHAIVRNADGSATHYFETRSERKVKRYEWLPAGTVDSTVAAAATRTGQESVYVDRSGEGQRTLWDGRLSTGSFWLKASYEWPTPLSRNAESKLAAFVNAGHGIDIAEVTPEGRARVVTLRNFDDAKLTNSSLVVFHPSEQFTSAPAIWAVPDTFNGKALSRTHIAATGINRDLKGVKEVTPGTSDFAGWTPRLLHAVSGPVAQSYHPLYDGPETYLFAFDRTGLVVSPATAQGSNSWVTIAPGMSSAHRLATFEHARDIRLFTLTAEGRAQMSTWRPGQNQVSWTLLPALPADRRIVGDLAAAHVGSDRLVVAHDDRGDTHVLSITEDGTATEWKTIPVAEGAAQGGSVGQPAVMHILSPGQAAVMTRDANGRPLISWQLDDGNFTPLKPMLSDTNPVRFQSDLRFIQGTRIIGMGRPFPWALIGSASDGALIAITPDLTAGAEGGRPKAFMTTQLAPKLN